MTLGEAHGRVILPAAIHASDGSELAVDAGINPVLLPKCPDHAGAEVGRLCGRRRLAVNPLRTALDVKAD